MCATEDTGRNWAPTGRRTRRTKMPEHTNRTFICSVLFLDIVEYSQRTVAEQIALKERFNKVLTEAIAGVPTDDRIILDTGDGAAVSFLGDPEEAAKESSGTGSDDIGDVTWNVPSVTLYYPANIPGLPGHNWSNAIAMATPIAHKGVTAGAKVQAMTIVDMLMRPELVDAAWDYFRNVQTKTQKYIPFITDKDQPAIELNAKIVDKYRDEMKKYYFDPTKYRTYLEQLGIKYPTVRQ